MSLSHTPNGFWMRELNRLSAVLGILMIMLWRQCFGGNHQRPDIIHSYRAEAVLPPSFGTGEDHGSHVKQSNGQPFNGSNSSMDPGVQHKRLFEPIGNIPPQEAERNDYNTLDQTPVAA